MQSNQKVPSVQFKRFILSDLVHEQASSHFLEVLIKVFSLQEPFTSEVKLAIHIVLEKAVAGRSDQTCVDHNL